MLKVIYHANCLDGFCAAWVIQRGTFGLPTEFIPAKYGDPIPTLNKGDDVVIVDFSYPRKDLLELKGKVKSLRVLDHHKTAQKDLIGIPEATFDMNMSGANLARLYEKCSPTAFPKHWITDAVEDRDLWKFKKAYSDEICLALGSCERSFDAWNKFEVRGEKAAIDAGKAIKNFRDQQVQSAVANSYLTGGGVATVNSAHFQSEIGHALLKQYPKALYADIWYENSKWLRVHSLRSEDSREDVSEIAKKFGGGGHRNAAGYTVEWKSNGK